MSYFNKKILKLLYEISPVELTNLVQQVGAMDDANIKSLCNFFGAKTGDIPDLAHKIGLVSDELRWDPRELTNSSVYIKNRYPEFVDYLKKISTDYSGPKFKNGLPIDISRSYKEFLKELSMEAKMTLGNVNVIGTGVIDNYIKNNKLGVSGLGIVDSFKNGFSRTMTTHAPDGTALVGDALAKAKGVAIRDAIFSGSKHALAIGGIIGGYLYIKSYFKSPTTEIDPKDLASDMETGKNIPPEVQAQLPSIPASSSDVKSVSVAIGNQMKEEGLYKYWKPVEEYAYAHSNYIIPLMIIGAAGILYKYKDKFKIK